MAGRRLIGARIPLVQRIKRYGSMATLFRSYDDSAESRLPSPELVVPRSIGDLNDASFEDASVVKATLLPGESSLPVGLMVPPVGLAPTAQRDPIDAPPVQREVRVPRTRPFQAPEAPSIPQAPQAEQAALERAKTPKQQPTSDSSISDADWTRLKAVMQGHQEKLAREKDSPEYIQRAKEEAEQEAARKKAEAETKRRQELARSGKLPKAQVVYLSPDQPAPIPVMPTDAPEIQPGEQERVEGVVEEPAIDEILDSGIEAVEEAQKEDIAKKPDTIEAAEPHRPEPLEVPKPVQQEPEKQEQEKRIPEPGTEPAAPREEVATTEQKPEPAEPESGVEPVAKTPQMEAEPAESTPLQEAETPSTSETAVESEEKAGIGRRLLDAARSVFRRAEEAPSPTEPSVPLPMVDEASSEVREEKPIDILATDEPKVGEDSQEAEYQPEQIEEEFQVRNVPDSLTVDTPVAQPTRPVVQRTPEKTAPKTPESPGADTLSRKDPASVEKNAQPEGATIEEPIGERVAEPTLAEPYLVEPTTETPIVAEPETRVQVEFESELPLAEPEAPAPMERRVPLPDASMHPVQVQEEPKTGMPETAEVQLEPEATGPGPAATESDVEAKVEVREEAKPSTKETAEQLELPPAPGEEERVDKLQPPLPLDSEERSTDLQQLPLEEVWPVQQAELAIGEPASEPAIQDSFPEQRDESGEMPTLIVQRETAEDVSSETELRATLDKVSPGKPTDSSIELVPPRRPRPSIVPEQTQLEDPGSTIPPSQPIQRHPEEPEPLETKPILDRLDGGSGEDRKITQPGPRPPQPETVKTEIGDLPRDLWQYLGEEPPSPTEPQAAADRPRVAADVATIQRSDVVATAPAKVLEYSQPTKTLGLDAVLPWIQRTDSGEQTETGEATSEFEEIDEDEESEAEGVDIEKLARDILPIIRRKLAIEWERNRGRF